MQTLQSNLSDVAPEHMQSIDIGSGGDNPVPTSGGLAGESIDSPSFEQHAIEGKVSLSDEEDFEIESNDADELER